MPARGAWHVATHSCSWCPSDETCVPRRDHGMQMGECSGLLLSTCAAPQREPPATSGSALSRNTSSGGGGGGSGGEDERAREPEEVEEALERKIRGQSDHSLRRIGVGVHVLNVGDIDLKAGKFYADLQLYLHVETEASGEERLYNQGALLDPNLASCGSMENFKPYAPSDAAAALNDKGLFLVNIDRYRSVSPVMRNGSLHHYRIQGSFYYRTNISWWPMNTERLEVVVEVQDEAVEEREQLFFCTMPEYSGLSNSIRFPGSIDNQRLSFEMATLETCGPPFLRPVRQCLEPDDGEEAAGMRPVERVRQRLFDTQCECDTVTDFHEGYDKESCGCQGGRVTSARLSFSVLYRTPEVGAFVSAFLAPLLIMVVNLSTYLIPAKAIETRFSLANSGLIGLVLFHAGLKAQTPVAGVLTLADKIFIGLYAVIGASFSVSSLMLSLHYGGRPAAANAVFLYMRPIGPALSVFLIFAPLVSFSRISIALISAGYVILVILVRAIFTRSLPWPFTWASSKRTEQSSTTSRSGSSHKPLFADDAGRWRMTTEGLIW